MRGSVAIAQTGRTPSPRALAAMAKLCGRRLERRWPFVPRAEPGDLNLQFRDLLELQYARSKRFTALVIGAFDGVTNDPASQFILDHAAHAIFVEPQRGPFERLSAALAGHPAVTAVNAAIDERCGTRTMYRVPGGIDSLPAWTEQLASFSREHLLSHEAKAPGLTAHIVEDEVPTLSFESVLERFDLCKIDLLQIDAEGFDAQLLAWFPFERVQPGVLYYETLHMDESVKRAVRERLRGLGYDVRTGDCDGDDMAIRF